MVVALLIMKMMMMIQMVRGDTINMDHKDTANGDDHHADYNINDKDSDDNKRW